MVFTYEILYHAWKQTSRGKSTMSNQIRYKYNLEEKLFDLQYRLNSKTFCPSPLRTKEIFLPKYRIAQVPTMEDKIVQHAICDNYAYEALTKPLIKETAACIRGRGTLYAIELMKNNLHRFWRKYHARPYVLKCDIHSYFDSIPHDRLRRIVDRHIDDEDIKHIILQFIDLKDRGLPLGLQQSQLLANLYLSEMDHKIKEQFRCKYYGRYMDDFYIFSDSYEGLETLLDWIKDYTRSIGLELNPKTAIISGDIDFLGFSFRLTATGKVVVRMQKSKKQTQKHRLRLMTKQIASGTITPEQAAASYTGWRVHASHGNCRNLLIAMDKYFSSQLSEIGYQLNIKEKQVIICQEQSQTSQQAQ